MEWRFNSPSSPWWVVGGEGSLGKIRGNCETMSEEDVRGKAVLSNKELTSVLCDCKSLIKKHSY